jgi:hypothetical protein
MKELYLIGWKKKIFGQKLKLPKCHNSSHLIKSWIIQIFQSCSWSRTFKCQKSSSVLLWYQDNCCTLWGQSRELHQVIRPCCLLEQERKTSPWPQVEWCPIHPPHLVILSEVLQSTSQKVVTCHIMLFYIWCQALISSTSTISAKVILPYISTPPHPDRA